MISLRGVTKLYGTVIGVNDVSVDLGAGAYGLLGPNGAGKTTFLGLVTGQLRPSMGKVRVFGERPFFNPRVLRRIGLCPASDITERAMSARDWVRYLVRLSGFTPTAAALRADRTLEQVGLGEAARRPLSTLSKGMRQRAKLAGAIAHDHDLLVLDEPFDGLDPVARHELVSLVRRWARSRSLLVASHLLHEVEALEAGLAVILGGRLVASGTVEEVRRLIDTLPSEVRVVCDAPRRLAEMACASPEADAVRFVGTDTFVVDTRAPVALAERIGAAASAEGILVRELVPGDRSLEGIFGRLVQIHRGEAS
ncbi:MAG: ABC transporter ATP-binding protein [Planctomycetaceae bacterium]